MDGTLGPNGAPLGLEDDTALRTVRRRRKDRPRSHLATDEGQRQAARLGDVGARAARVAHELKVPVSVISGSLENLEHYLDVLVRYVRAAEAHLASHPELAALRDELGVDYVVENAAALLQLCRDGSQQLNHVVQQIKTYVGPAATPLLTRTVDVGATLGLALAMVAASRDRTPRVHSEICGPLVVRGAPASLQQAFVNILSNAFDAIDTVADAQVWIGGRRLAAAGEWIEIRVRDNGPGIPAAIRQRIFDPFFTTKAHGGGLGLGLAITREVIEAHGGTLQVADTSPGATFVIQLPAALST